MSPRPFLAATVVMVAAAGCGWNDAVDSRTATAGLPTTRQLIEEHEWVLERGESSLEGEDDNPVTLSVVDDDVSGMGPCNRYRGRFSLGNDDTVEISHIASTLRACGGSTMEAEDEFLAALEAVDTVEVDQDDNDRLVLHDGEVRLVFSSYDADELLTTTWNVVEVATGDSLDSILLGTEPTLTFTEDGHVTMATGCNTASATWELDGDRLSIGSVRLTRKFCADPPGVMDQEQALVDALEAAGRVEISPGELTILDEAGAIALRALT
ncbi:MAG TPA: META domain-containing protein [Acidimicrobiales bacterium]|nr:META domain-containing protein [Acidimicrobiales bacterium]